MVSIGGGGGGSTAAAAASASAAAGSALDAAASAAQAAIDRAAAQAAAVSVPIFKTWLLDGPPGLNVGNAGDDYVDTAAGVIYGPKSNAGVWPSGVPYSGSLANASPKSIVDLRTGQLGPVLTCTRASAATNLLYSDPPGAAYSVFAANEPIWRADLGVGSFTNCTNFFLNSTAPVTQTINLAVGTYILWGNGTGSLTAAAATAVGTGFGTLATLQGNFLTLVITTGGTVTITVTGSVNAVQLEGTDLPGNGRKGPTPLIVTAGAAATRASQTLAFAGALLAAVQAAAGTIVIETEAVGIGSPAQTARFMMVNGQALIYAANTTLMGYFKSGGTNYQWTSGVNVQTARARHGLAWSAGSMSAVSGGGTLVTNANSFNDGAAVTSAHLGSDTQTQVTNGWFRKIHYWTSRLSDTLLKDEVSAAPAPVSSISNWSSPIGLPKWKAAKQQVAAGIRNAVIAVLGDSQSVGTMSTTNFRASSWPMQMASLIAAQTGLPVGTDSWFGYNNTGANWTTWDTRLSLTGSVGASWGATFGGSFLRMLNASSLAFTPTRAVDTYKVWYTTNTGNGSFTVSDGAGNTSAAVNCNAATAVQSMTFTRTSSSNPWTIAATGEVHIIGGYCYLSTQKEISVFVGGRAGWGAQTFTTNGSAAIENNAALVMPSLGIDCLVLALTINDVTLGTTLANYQTYMTSLANSVKNAGGDVLFQSSAAVNWGVSGFPAYAAAIPYVRAANSLAYSLGGPFIDQVARWGGVNAYATYNPAGWYFDAGHMTAAGYADLAIDPAKVLAA